jgi:hypothetical protein
MNDKLDVKGNSHDCLNYFFWTLREIMKIWLTLAGLWAQEIKERNTTADLVWDFKNYKQIYI